MKTIWYVIGLAMSGFYYTGVVAETKAWIKDDALMFLLLILAYCVGSDVGKLCRK